MAPAALRFQPFLLRTAGRPGRPAHARQDGDAFNHFLQAPDRFFLILFLAAVRLRLDDHLAIPCDALIAQPEQTLLDVFGQ